MSAAVRSGILVLAISSHWARVSFADLCRYADAPNLLMPAAFLMRDGCRRRLHHEGEDLSAKAVITTGIGRPGSTPWSGR